MSYSYPSEQPRRRKGGGMFFLIILAVGAFLLFSNSGRQEKPAGDILAPPSDSHAERERESDREYNRQRDEILGNDDDIAKGQPMPSTGGTGAAKDWSIDDVANQKNATSTQSSKTQKGDWSIEEVDNKQDNNQFKFSDSKTDAKPKKDDWAIEDINKNKKTESGDWAIEETTTSEKDK